MFVRQKIDFSSQERPDSPIIFFILLGVLLASAALLNDLVQREFALDVMQASWEAVAVIGIIGLPCGIVLILSILVCRWLGRDAIRFASLTTVVLLPMVIFLGHAHCAMSRSLAPLKRSFKEKAEAAHGRPGGACLKAGCTTDQDLADILKRRDRHLAEYGYLRLGGWREGHGGVDCQGVYLFTVGLFTERPWAAMSQNSSRGAF